MSSVNAVPPKPKRTYKKRIKELDQIKKESAKTIRIENPAKLKAKEEYENKLKEIDRPKTKEDKIAHIKNKFTDIYDNPDLSHMTTDNLHTWIVGMTGSGKTNLGMLLLLCWMRNPATKFDKIYIICPTEFDIIQDGSERKNWTHFKNPNIFFERPTDALWENIKENHRNGLKTVVVYDDVTQYIHEIRDPESLACRIATMGRHKNCRVVMLVHNMVQCSPIFRDNMGDLFITKMPQPRYHKMVCDMINNCQLPNSEKMEIFDEKMGSNKYVLCHIPLVNTKQQYPFLFFKPALVKQ